MGSEEQKRGGGSLGMGWGWILEYGKGEEQEDGAERERGEKRNVSESRRQRQGWHMPGLEGKEERSIEDSQGLELLTVTSLEVC